MVEAARRKYPDLAISQADARDLSQFDDETFALVFFSYNGIDAVDATARRDVVREAFRVLRPGGIFLFSTHNAVGPLCGEKPWRLGPAEHSTRLGRLRQMVERTVAFPSSMAGYRRTRRLASAGDGYRVLPAAAHRFGIVVYYTTIERQLRDLAAAGFDPYVDIYDQAGGNHLGAADDVRAVHWFYFLARRPTAA